MFRRTVTTRLGVVAAAGALALTVAASAQAATRPPTALAAPASSLVNPNLFKPNLTATQSAGVVTIKNAGIVSSGAFTIGTWRATTAVKQPVLQTRVPNLAPGASIRLSPGTEGGLVRADILNEVAESNENDNAVFARLQS
jgi:hypothetical protein